MQTEQQIQAKKHLASLALPSASEERWRRSAPELFSADRFVEVAAGDQHAEFFPSGWQDLRATCHVIVAKSGTMESVGLPLPKGIRIVDGQGAEAAALRKTSGTHEARWFGGSAYFQTVQRAFDNNGLAIHVDADVRVERPIVVIRPSQVDSRGQHVPQVCSLAVVLGARSEVTIVEEYVAQEAGGQILQDVEVGEYGKVRLVLLSAGANVQDVAGAYLHQCSTHLHAGAEANVWFLLNGMQRLRSFVDCHLQGVGAQAELKGIVVGQGRQHIDVEPVMFHSAAKTQSQMLFKNALTGRSRAVFQGEIDIVDGAPDCEAYQSNKNLLLSETARVDTLPKLSIRPSQVRCKHGAATGNLDKTQIYYLTSRGFTREQAIQTIVHGFLKETLNGLTDEALQAYCSNRLTEWGHNLASQVIH